MYGYDEDELTYDELEDLLEDKYNAQFEEDIAADAEYEYEYAQL